ncbi:hypothetical protein CVT25_007445 [Psilocybe cyanescens]|uniref:EVE domain-containing protein n=1 Tax=Psilocybe cyanescens TaxID=93625 RepID=A0A409XVM2_PSICY|nr:hypothetical protein CVT25_007445 [Psilocybe cyanescens]
MSSSTLSARYWLLKAEPDTRIVKGKDVKFSVDDFEHVKTSPWEGVRNYEARNLMKEMKEGDKALFYHSNCKVPGIAAFAQVSKEAYPDFTAWDSSHPYYDPKSDPKEPKWFMVDLTFTSRAPHFVPLALLRKISDLAPSPQGIPDEIAYIGEAGVASIKTVDERVRRVDLIDMDLVTRGRLSVQRVDEGAWKAINELAKNGGWEDMDLRPGKKGNTIASANPKSKMPKKKASAALQAKEDIDDSEEQAQTELENLVEKVIATATTKGKAKRKREAQAVGEPESALTGERDGLRRSTRAKK